MAEVISIVASGIAISQLSHITGSTVLKLKQLWNEVEGAHEVIEDLMAQIDCLDPTLWEAEHTFSQEALPSSLWNDTAAKNSAKYCRIALQKLTSNVNDLSTQIRSAKRYRRKFGAVKVVLKRAQLKDLENKLENAVRVLSIAQGGYLM